MTIKKKKIWEKNTIAEPPNELFTQNYTNFSFFLLLSTLYIIKIHMILYPIQS